MQDYLSSTYNDLLIFSFSSQLPANEPVLILQRNLTGKDLFNSHLVSQKG